MKVLINGEDGKKTIALITAIYKASITKQPVKLPITKDDPYYTIVGIQNNAPHFYEKNTSIENFDNENITIGRDIK